jgi:hypothetical protein
MSYKLLFVGWVNRNGVYFLLVGGIMLMLGSDILASHDVFGITGFSLALGAVGAFVIASGISRKISVLLGVGSLVNGALCYRIAQKLMVSSHSDVFGTDAWIIVGVWAWFGGGILCLLVGITMALLKGDN